MKGLIKKDFITYFFGAIIILSPILIIEKMLNIQTNLPVIILNHLITFILSILPFMIVEQNDEKNDFLIFVSMLPITKFEIVSTKFLLSFLSILSLALINYFNIFLTRSNFQEYLLVANSFILNGLFMITISGICYIGIFKHGYTKFLVIVGVITALSGLIPPILISNKVLNINDMLSFFKNILSGFNFITLTLSLLILYIFLMLFGLKVFNYEKKDKEAYLIDF